MKKREIEMTDEEFNAFLRARQKARAEQLYDQLSQRYRRTNNQPFGNRSIKALFCEVLPLEVLEKALEVYNPPEIPRPAPQPPNTVRPILFDDAIRLFAGEENAN